MREFTVNFKPQARSVKVPQGTDILRAATKAGIVVAAPCGGGGLCGKCRVIVDKGRVKTEVSRLVSEPDRLKGVVLACQTLVEDDLELTLPAESVESHQRYGREAEDFSKGTVLRREDAFRYAPIVRKIYLELPKPTPDDNTSDLDRVVYALKDKAGYLRVSTGLANLKHLSEELAESDYRITVTLAYREGLLDILSFEQGDTSADNYAFAFDIGTTTVVGQLIDVGSKKILGTRISFNRQAVYGSDVISRIIFAAEPEGMERLNAAVIDNMNEIIEDLIAAHKVSMSDVNAVVAAGNMTMMHLLLKIDPSGIRKAPYIPAVSVFPSVSAAELDLGVNPKAIAEFLPGVSTYIGGDIVSGVLACGVSESEDLTLLVDIGTNGEIVLGNRDWMIGAAASAGPSFEGSGLACGMKAVTGAIQKLEIGSDLGVEFRTIGGTPPKGVCGSGYIDILCQMLKRGIIGKDGKINRELKSRRIRKSENSYEFVIAFAKETAIARDIVIQDDDIENLKRSKGAIYSAIIALVKKVGKDISEVKKVYIAGGFGNYLNIENSIFIGLLPDIARDVYEFVGNSSLAGARMSLLSTDAMDRSLEIYKNITYLDLSGEPGYMDEYIASLFFPHTDLGRFPSVRL